MIPFPYINRVVVRRESGQGDPDAHVLTGAAADLRAVLEELLVAVTRVESQGDETGFHAVIVGDGSARYEFSHIAVRVDPNLDKHRRRTRQFWRFYDSNFAGVVVLALLLLVMIGAHTVWEWVTKEW